MSGKDDPRSRGRPWLILLALGLLAAVVYLPSILRAEFLNFDDNLFFDPVTNSEFADGGLARILHPGRTIANAYLPVSHLSLWVDYQLTGSDPLWPHLHSLMLHVLAAWILVYLGAALGLSRTAAFAAGAFFLVHPALVESVAWVSSRKDLLSGIFVFLSLLLVARNAGQPRPGLAAGAVACGVLALYAKATAIVLPALAALVCLALETGGRRRWVPVLCLAAVSLAAGLHHFLLASSEGTLVPVGGDLGLRATQVPGAFLHYLRVLVWPDGLNILYPEVQTMEAFRARLGAGVLVLGASGAVALVLARSRRYRGIGLALVGLLVALLPFNTAFPASSVAAADRYLYLAVPALALACAGLGRTGAALLLAACLPLAWLSADRAGDFRDSERVWRRSLEVAPENAVAKLNLSADLQLRRPSESEARRQLLEGALEDARYPVHRLAAVEALRNLAVQRAQEEESLRRAEQAVVLSEQLPPGPLAGLRLFQNLLDAATLLRNAGRDEESARYFARAAALFPEHPTLLVHRALGLLAEAMDETGRVEAGDPRWPEAQDLLQRAFASEPGHFEGHLVRGSWLQALGEYLTAAAEYKRAIAAEPGRSQGYLALADLFLSHDLPDEAADAVQKGIGQGVVDPALQQRWAMALVRQGKLDMAKRLLQDYLELRPRDEASRRILADLLASEALTGLYQLPPEELEKLALRLQELNPDHPKLHVVLGKLARDHKQWAAALGHLEKARAGMADDEDIQRMLAETHRDLGYDLLGVLARTSPSPEQKAEAMDHFRAFLDLATPELPTEAVEGMLDVECRRLAELGAQLFNNGDLDATEAAFRRCVALRPEKIQYQCQLGQVLMHRGPAGLEEAERRFAAAVRSQREQGLDPSMPLRFRLDVLQRLGRGEEALEIGRAFLAEPGDADPVMVEAIRRAIDG